MDESDADQRETHRKEPNEPVSAEDLAALGVEAFRMEPDESSEELRRFRDERGFSYHDVVDIHKDRMPGYDEKIKHFFTEHIHTDDEVRFVLDGSGYFDIRDGEDRWIRIYCEKGDMIIIPEGIYHRFTLDTNNYIKAMRLFAGVPVWTPHNRPDCDEMESRASYVTRFLSPTKKAREDEDTAALAAEGDAAASGGAAAADAATA